MIIPGVLSQMAQLVSGGGGGVRPVFVAVASSAATSGSLSVALPAGWVSGQLAIMSVISEVSKTAPAGWNAIGSEIVNNTAYASAYWRILQIGDSSPVLPSATDTVAVVWTFEAGTFNPTTPVAEIATQNTGSLSTNHSVPSSTTVAAGQHFVMHLDSGNSGFATVSSYPYAAAQHTRGIGVSPTYSICTGCGVAFDGGVSASTTVVVSANTRWIGRKIVIVGSGYTA